MKREQVVKRTGRELSFSESVKRLNPDLFGLDTVGAPKRKQDSGKTLDRQPSDKKEVAGGVGYCVTFIALRERILDGDNSATPFKYFRDEVSRTLGVDDGDKRIRWEYEQVETRGQTGTIVRIDIYEI